MSDLPVVETPIVVNPSPISAQALSAARVAVMIVAAITSVMGFLDRGDLAGLILYLQSDAFLPALAALIGLATFVWSQIRTRREQAKKVIMADAAPNNIARVETPKGDMA